MKRKNSLRPSVADRIARAIVRISRLGGHGVVVPGGFVVTAAHCIGWTAEGWMALGDHYTEEIVVADGRNLKVRPLALEPVSDLAVLGAIDEQEFPKERDAWDSFCEATEPVPLALDEFRVGIPRDAFLFTHNKGMILPCRATQWTLGAATLDMEADAGVEGGTSGCPVVTREGTLLGVLSTAAGLEGKPTRHCTAARVHLAAPVWLIRQIIPQAARRRVDASFPPGRWAPDRAMAERQRGKGKGGLKK